MHSGKDDPEIQDKIKKLLENPPEYRVSDSKRTEFIARLYKIREEKKSVEKQFSYKDFPRFATVAVTLIAAIFSYTYLFSPMYPVVSNMKGTVKIFRSSKNEWVFAQADEVKLYKNDILKTFGDGEADVLVKNVYHIRLKNNSEIKLACASSRLLSGNIKYELAKGRVFAHYNKKHPADKEFNVETEQAEASALGTDFMVESKPLFNSTWVGVLDGVVKVMGKEEIGIPASAINTVLVKPGEKTVVRQGSSPTKPQRLMEDELLELEELYNIGVRPQVAILISTGETRTRELLSVTPLYISSASSGAVPDRIQRIAATISKAIKEGSKEKHAESIKELEELVKKYPNPKYDVQFFLFIGAYYEYLNEHNKAIEAFNKVLANYPQSSLASIARCAIGIIYEEKLDDAVKAKEAYHKVLNSYPNSPEAEEATAGLSRLSK